MYRACKRRPLRAQLSLKHGLQLDNLHLGGETRLFLALGHIISRPVTDEFHDAIAVQIGYRYGMRLPWQTWLTVLTTAQLHHVALTSIHYVYLRVVHVHDAHALREALLVYQGILKSI
jgi:hypothetical protein